MPAVSAAHLKCMETPHHLEGLEPLISIEELSEYLGVPVKTIYDWRLTGNGPCAIRVGRQLRYADLATSARGWPASARAARTGSQGG